MILIAIRTSIYAVVIDEMLDVIRFTWIKLFVVFKRTWQLIIVSLFHTISHPYESNS
jgi:hypothetical protein